MNQYDAIYLSPHLDDVVLSCGGQIARETAAGRRILVVTLMAGDPPPRPLSPYARWQHERWGLTSAAAAARRAEDIAACRLLGADSDHWSVPDCIYRGRPATGEPFYNSDDELFGRVHPLEYELVDRLAARLGTLPAAGRLISPLGVGHHVDHQLTRLAAERGAHSAPVSYYEDYPYVREAGALEAYLVPASAWRAEVISLSRADLARKIEAILAYRSQVGMFFADAADVAFQIDAYAKNVGGERLWHPL